MGAPEIIMICLYAITLYEHITKDGEPREGQYSWIGALIGTGIGVGLLWWGGFFK